MTNIPKQERAQILTEALPYIQEFYDKVVVIKYGGNAMINEERKQQVMEDIVLLSLVGIKVVLVHGGGPEITETLERMGKQTEFVNGLRVRIEKQHRLCKWCWRERSIKRWSICCKCTAAAPWAFPVWTDT